MLGEKVTTLYTGNKLWNLPLCHPSKDKFLVVNMGIVAFTSLQGVPLVLPSESATVAVHLSHSFYGAKLK